MNSPRFQRYTDAVELAKYCEREMMEVEYEDALEVAGYCKECECLSVLSTLYGSKFFNGSLDAYKAEVTRDSALVFWHEDDGATAVKIVGWL